MKTVTAAFLAAQAKNNIQYFYEINMYRRYWDAGTSAYVWETTPIDLTPYVLTKASIAWKLDTEGLNVWKVSNTQLELKNDKGQWNENSGTYFNSTYMRYKTKIEIKVGYILADYTTETVYAFTGYIIGDITNNTKTQSVVVPLSGKEILLTLTNAEDVCQTVTGETLGTGALVSDFYTPSPNVLSVSKVYKNGVEQTLTTHYTVSNLYQKYYGAKIHCVTAPALEDIITCDYVYGNNQISEGEQIGTGVLNAEFTTANKGVGFIDAIYVDGQALTEGIDYDVSDLNDKDSYAKITFPLGAGVGQVVTGDYRHWYKDIAITTLLGYLLDAAGFPAADRTIGAINLEPFLKYKIWNTKPEWEAMDSVSRNADTTTKVGTVMQKSENLVTDVAENVNVTIAGSYPAQTAVITSIGTAYANKYEGDVLPTSATPVWSKHSAGTYVQEIAPAGILHLSANSGGDIYYYKNLYPTHATIRCKLKASDSGGGQNFNFDLGVGNIYISYYGGNDWQLVVMGSGNMYSLPITGNDWGDYHIFEFKFIGTWIHVIMDGNYIGLADYTVYTRTSQFGITNCTFPSAEAWVDYLYDGVEPVLGRLVSSVIDLGAGTHNYGTFLRTWTDPGDGSTLTVFTQTSTTPDFSSGNDYWNPVSFVGNVGTVLSSTAAQKYLRWAMLLYGKVATSPTLTYLALPVHLVDVVDCGTNLDVYNAMTLLKQDNYGTSRIWISTSPDDITYDPEVEYTAGFVGITNRRYAQFRTVTYRTSVGSSPETQKEYFTYRINSLNVAMADFTGMFVWDVLAEFAKLIDYEIGVDAAGKYFFREKNTDTTIDLELKDTTNIISLDNDSSGWYRIFNKIKVAIGKFISIMSPITENEAAPHSITKYGTRELSIESSSIKIDDDLDLSSELVRTYYDKYKNPKRELRLLCKMLPQLELSDTVNINYLAPSWVWFLGDPTKKMGVFGTMFIGKNSLPVFNLVSNVVGIELNITTWKLYVSVREI